MNQRMKWDAEATFKSLNAQGKRRQASIDDERLKTTPYTPPPNVAAWLRAQADKPKGRDYDAILRAAKKPPVGYYEDAPRGIKFGGQPLPSAGHGKDVDTTNGPWPKWAKGAYHRVLMRSAQECDGIAFDIHGYADQATCVWWCGSDPVWTTESEAAQWLEAHGHKDVAAQLRGKAINSLSIPTKLIGEKLEPERTIPVVGDRFNFNGEVCTVTRIDHTREFAVRFLRCEASHEDGVKISYFTDKNPIRILKRPTPPRDDVATGGGRVWRNAYGVVRTEVGGNHFLKTLAWGVSLYAPDAYHLEVNEYTELHGPERDAILSECRKAMGL